MCIDLGTEELQVGRGTSQFFLQYGYLGKRFPVQPEHIPGKRDHNEQLAKPCNQKEALFRNINRITVTGAKGDHRSEEHTSELQSLMRISYAVFCLKKKIR